MKYYKVPTDYKSVSDGAVPCGTASLHTANPSDINSAFWRPVSVGR